MVFGDLDVILAVTDMTPLIATPVGVALSLIKLSNNLSLIQYTNLIFNHTKLNKKKSIK